jgi:hypothetical protein
MRPFTPVHCDGKGPRPGAAGFAIHYHAFFLFIFSIYVYIRIFIMHQGFGLTKAGLLG